MPYRTGRSQYRFLESIAYCSTSTFRGHGATSSSTLSSWRSWSSKRYIVQTANTRKLQSVPTLPSWDLDTFRERAFIPQLPTLLPPDVAKQPPAFQTWLETSGQLRILRFDYLRRYENAIVRLELTRKDNKGTETFERFNAPLKLFLDSMQHQSAAVEAEAKAEVQPASPSYSFSKLQLYLAQSPISDLPEPLQADITVPDLVVRAGKGDLYDANIWIGLPPTYTPLHRDPNPNFFLQLAGTKAVRLFPPDVGRAIFDAVQAKLGRDGSAVFRGEEMMQGAEREMLEQAVWGDGGEALELLLHGIQRHGFEAMVHEGNALFIPLGWWHSIKGVGTGVTSSVNWWFR